MTLAVGRRLESEELKVTVSDKGEAGLPETLISKHKTKSTQGNTHKLSTKL